MLWPKTDTTHCQALSDQVVQLKGWLYEERLSIGMHLINHNFIRRYIKIKSPDVFRLLYAIQDYSIRQSAFENTSGYLWGLYSKVYEMAGK